MMVHVSESVLQYVMKYERIAQTQVDYWCASRPATAPSSTNDHTDSSGSTSHTDSSTACVPCGSFERSIATCFPAKCATPSECSKRLWQASGYT